MSRVPNRRQPKQRQLGIWIGLGISLILVSIFAVIFFTIWSRQNTVNNANLGRSTSQSATSKSQTESTVSSSTTTSQAGTIFPSTLLGTWSIYDQNMQTQIRMTFSENGKVETVIGNAQYISQVKQTIQVGSGLYRYVLEDDSQTAALSPGAQIGGAYVKYDFGIRISSDGIQPVIWQAASNESFDYSQPLQSREDLILTKNGTSTDKTSSPIREDRSVDTRSLTTEQVNNWAIAAYRQENGTDSSNSDYQASSWMGDDHLVYIRVRPSSQSTSPAATGGYYRVNANGYLEESTDSGQVWTVISRYYLY
ncbi:hypothetical protein [Streptococcus sp. DD13]|uniref:hypothetical protein n=1 Tax=Streptococcus sp. DD13 TaxID=1777881 RepID=UPI000791C6A9|nr:hypothetical protein [Streptococcus sp. DD13]KXT78980.1 hypothetical protein STRDD13_00323 [Streptococcus sp. DD13]